MLTFAVSVGRLKGAMEGPAHPLFCRVQGALVKRIVSHN